jgi:hypothetical protein
MQTETRGRKRLPENQKKKPITLFLTADEVALLGGEKAAKNILQDYSLFKIKQNAKKQTIQHP